MKPNLLTSNSFTTLNSLTPPRSPVLFPSLSSNPKHQNRSLSLTHLPSKRTSSCFLPICSSNPTKQPNCIQQQSSNSGLEVGGNSNDCLAKEELERNLNVQVGNPIVPSRIHPLANLSLSDQAFFLLSFIVCTTFVASTSLVVAAVPTLHAMGRAATSLSKLADTAREELPSTMAAIRLSGMEISDLTLELSDLSQEIADGVNKSAQAVQAAEAGIRQIGVLARQHTISMIQERASLPIISLQPVVAGAVRKTSRAVGQATKTFMNIISRGEFNPGNEDDGGIDRVEI